MYKLAYNLGLQFRLCLDEGKRGEKVTSVTVVHWSIFRLFVVNIVLP